MRLPLAPRDPAKSSVDCIHDAIMETCVRCLKWFHDPVISLIGTCGISLDFCISKTKLFVAALEACFHFGLFPFEMFLQHSLFVVFSSKCTSQKDIKVLAGEYFKCY